MKKTLMSLLSLLALSSLFTLTSCQKEQVGNGTQFHATMEGCTAKDGKTALSGTTLNWEDNDYITIYGTTGAGIYRAQPQIPATVAIFDNISGETGDGPFRAYYPSTLTTDGTKILLPSAQSFVQGSIYRFPMYTESANNRLSFKNLCGVLKLHLTKTNINISSIAVTASCPINGEFTVNYNNGNPLLTPVSSDMTATSVNTTTVLSCTAAQAIDNGKDFYIYLPAGNYTGLQITLNTDDSRYCIKTANTVININRSQYTTISLGENDMSFVDPLPQGALSGLFTINEYGDKVRFSQGNLQYQASSQTWRFAEHQYDYVGDANYGNVYENGVKCSNALISGNYAGWIDLFGRGTGNNPINTSINDYDYVTFVDWGTNAISNGGNQPNTWRTLTAEEWGYIFNLREEWEMVNPLLGRGIVNGMHGLIILPDDWSLPVGCTFTGIHYDDYNQGWNNTYTLTQWAAMEAAGAVFLPAAGSRVGTSVYGVNTYGGYWTPNGFFEELEEFVYATPLIFYTGEVYFGWYDREPYSGYSVRLVRNSD